MRDANWIEGGWKSAESGDTFEAALKSASGAPRDWWPRSAPEDLLQALEGILHGAQAWRRVGRQARAEALRGALDRWQDDTAGLDELSSFLGFEDGDLDERLEQALLGGDRQLAREQPEQAGDERAVLLRAPAGEFYAGLMRALPPLLAGRPLLLLSDPDLPQLARDFVAQLVADERLAQCVALLHEDRSSCLSTALASDALSWAYVPGLDRARLVPSSGALAALGRTRSKASFGAGVLADRGACVVQIDDAPLMNSGMTVLEFDDPRAAAREAYERAFGPLRALSGQAADQVGRVLCHERVFSPFTETLLELVEEGRRRHACPLFTSGLRRHCAELRRLGLDEGATLVEDGLDARTGFRGGSREAILAPSVFTNVEPTMGVARASRPAPVLALLRVKSDTEARALCGRT